MVDHIRIRGARVHNLKNVNVDVPLGKIVGVAGVSGSGKSSLALGVLYAEGSRRYLDALSTYTRRRMTQAAKASVDEVLYVPAALALHQRPAVPGIRSTFGTGTELLNSLRLMFSRLSSYPCPQCGHWLEPSLAVAAEKPLLCPQCGASVRALSAEEFAFNSQGACRTCSGTGMVMTVDESTLVPDDSLTIDEGAVAPWKSLMWSLMVDICREMGVRTDVPFRDLTDREKDIVFHGPAEKKHIFYHNKNSNQAGELDFTYFNATYTVENALSKVKDEKGMKRVEKFLRQGICPDCGGSRYSREAAAVKLPTANGEPASMADLMDMDVSTALETCADCKLVRQRLQVLKELGLGYLTLGEETPSLSGGEAQRLKLASEMGKGQADSVFVFDEPTIGLHPLDVQTLLGVFQKLIGNGATVVVIEHDLDVIRNADYLVDMGPGGGDAGGRIVAAGTPEQVRQNPESITGRYI